MPSTSAQNDSLKKEITAVSIPRLVASSMSLPPEKMLNSMKPGTPPQPDGKVMEESDTPEARFSWKDIKGGDEEILLSRILPENAEMEEVA